MPMTGELIRLQNYVDDIAATLRRISANVTFMTDDERKRLAEYMKKSDPNFNIVLERLEKGQ
ncbi:MAG: hypothetical protein ABIP81_06405 [Terriglobales bacterium]